MTQGSEDPFASFDRTVIKPSGGRARSAAITPPTGAGVPPQRPTRPPDSALPDILAALGKDASINPLVSAAAPMLAAYSRIRVLPNHPNPHALRDSLADGVRAFETTARAAGLANEQVIAGRYVLCTLLDEAASGTPWGGSGIWAGQGLLVTFHNETWGGEKFFQLLTRVIQDPVGNRHLLELLAVSLYLGFEGRYKVQQNGAAQLETVRERVMDVLQQGAPRGDRELSPHWLGERAAGTRLRDGMPVWVVAAFTGVALAAVFFGLRLAVNARTDPTFASLQSIDVRRTAAPALAAAAAPVPPRLSAFLKPEVDAGLVEVRDLADRSVVTIRGDGFFDPGSAQVAQRVLPLLQRIGQALATVQGSVLVTGHTDNQPIRSLKYPSNWHLSRDRAEAVRAVIAQFIPAQRLRAEGRADNDPLQTNDTPAGRSRNRRVEITLQVAAAN